LRKNAIITDSQKCFKREKYKWGWIQALNPQDHTVPSPVSTRVGILSGLKNVNERKLSI
jgi:hypothetical protein